jgi:hypothetical protein
MVVEEYSKNEIQIGDAENSRNQTLNPLYSSTVPIVDL